jgi:hypothetical protein
MQLSAGVDLEQAAPIAPSERQLRFSVPRRVGGRTPRTPNSMMWIKTLPVALFDGANQDP